MATPTTGGVKPPPLQGRFPPVRLKNPASPQEITAAIRANSKDVGVGVLDTRTGEIHLSPASKHPGHPDVVIDVLKIDDAADANHLRGFVVGKVGEKWQIVNNSSLNPDSGRMEQELFNQLVNTLMPLLESTH